MLRSRLFWKLLLAFAALNVFTAIALVRLTVSWVEEGAFREVDRKLSVATRLMDKAFADRLLQEPSVDLQRELVVLGKATGYRYTLITLDGEVLADSSQADLAAVAELENHSQRPEVVAASAHTTGIDQRTSSTTQTPYFYLARQVRRENEPIGYMRAAVPIEAIEQKIATLQARYWWLAAVVGLVMLAVTYALVRHIVGPVIELNRAANAIAAGNYNRRISVPNNDELGALSQSFNRMSQELGSQLTELRESDERQATVLGGMIEGVIAVDGRQRVLFANTAAGKLFGFIPPEIASRPLLEVVRNHALAEAVADSLMAGQPQRLEIEWEGSGRRILSVQVSPLPGKPCPGVIAVLHDTTELRRLETLRREFVANVSHELKTPLSSIKAYTETLLGGAINDPVHGLKFLNRIEEQADRLDALIRDMLHLARIESARQPFEIAAVRIAPVVNACLEDYQTLADGKQIELSSDPNNPPLEVKADAEGLRVILSNLVDNAIKYTPEGGIVVVRWHPGDDGRVLIEVADTGTGITDAEQARVFERFYRVDKARSSEIGGTGLGLSIVKHLSQSFGGSVSVKSAEPCGTIVIVELLAV